VLLALASVTLLPSYGQNQFDSVSSELMASLPCIPPPSGLVGWWPGDGNANDAAEYSLIAENFPEGKPFAQQAYVG
jgi:hypothetical protein